MEKLYALIQLVQDYREMKVEGVRVMTEPKLCPDCPLISLLPIIMTRRVTYMREKQQLTPHKICQLLRALWCGHPYVTLEGCPHFSQTERIDLYAKAPAENR